MCLRKTSKDMGAQSWMDAWMHGWMHACMHAWLLAARGAGFGGRSSLVPVGEAPLVRGGMEGPGPPSPGLRGLLAAGRGWQVCRGCRQSCCPGGEIPASAFVPQSLLPRRKLWDRVVPSCSFCSHVFLLPLLLSPWLPSAARSSPALAAAPRRPHVCCSFLSCPAVEADARRVALLQHGGPGVVFCFSRIWFME